MPIYDLRCTNCKEITEEFIRSFWEVEKLFRKEYKFSCPSCGGKGYKRLPSKVAKAVVK